MNIFSLSKEIAKLSLRTVLFNSRVAMSAAVTTKEGYLSMSLDEKRKLYKCGDNFVTLDQIPDWTSYSASHQLKKGPTIDEYYKPNEDFNRRVSIFTGDITKLEIDAIVNAANERLAGGGGVDGAIHAAAGRDLLQNECSKIGGCETGQVKITGGYKLPAKYVIHAVGPRDQDPKLLASCYSNALNTLQSKNLKSIAFPCISTGIFNYPNESAAKVALRTVRQWIETNEYYKCVDRIIFCLFLQVDIDAYHKLMPAYFPIEA